MAAPFCAAISCSTSAKSSRTRSNIPFAIWTAKAILGFTLAGLEFPGRLAGKPGGNSPRSRRQLLRGPSFAHSQASALPRLRERAHFVFRVGLEAKEKAHQFR